ncbi:MAG: multidrug effflux MFS transporter [Defluviimonas sp.]|uniref:multidrug effflux MFS transporter n=1 Tax=Albidovulum sp. TaxID=1872424 RepID=UPI001D4286B2|nr:multidrug effflux MFS transporter [Paracoccaceae bacterium]MCC0065361.1 multidrug effflux MFS transporter [Defluviimonas sp.]
MSENTPRPVVRFLDRQTPPHIVTLVAVTGLSALAMNIFLPSLPAMATWFGTDYRVMQLSVPLYLAFSAVLQVIIGPISDRYGRRRVLIGTTAIFLVATLGAMAAPTAFLFLVFRMAQAVVAAGMALSRAVIRDMVPPEHAASMIGYVTMGMAFVPMVGPLVGGKLEELFGWQASFACLFLIGLATLWLVLRDLGETRQGEKVRFAEQGAQYPELLRSPRFWGYSSAAACISGAFFAYLGGGPFIGSEIFHLAPATLGLYLSAPAVGYAAGNFLSGRYAARVGLDPMVLAGSAIVALAMATLALLGLAGLAGPNLFFGLMIFLGLGNGIALPSANAGILSVRPAIAGAASGLGGALMIGGGAAISAATGAALSPDAGGAALTALAAIMCASAIGGVLSILFVMSRNRRRA